MPPMQEQCCDGLTIYMGQPPMQEQCSFWVLERPILKQDSLDLYIPRIQPLQQMPSCKHQTTYRPWGFETHMPSHSGLYPAVQWWLCSSLQVLWSSLQSRVCPSWSGLPTWGESAKQYNCLLGRGRHNHNYFSQHICMNRRYIMEFTCF